SRFPTPECRFPIFRNRRFPRPDWRCKSRWNTHKFANEDDEHSDADAYVTIQACIDGCKGFDVFVIATVNDKWCLPESLLRAGRFDKVIPVSYPESEDSAKIIEHYLEKKQLADSIDIEELSRLLENHSCAELETAINDAGIYAAYEGRERIEYEDLKRACIRMLFEGPERERVSRGNAEEKIAYHEAGHVTIVEVLNPGRVNLVTTKDYYGEHGGVVKVHHDSDMYQTNEDIEEGILRDLGGKAAIEVVYGTADVGCSSDIESAFEKVTDMIDETCVRGFGAYIEGYSSEHRRETKDRLVEMEMDRYYREAKRILIEHRGLLEAIHDELMVKKTLTFRDIERIRKAA
ncbi:cell division protease FtsH, partial [Lachnospiraceae bacterium XBB2008]